MCYGFLLSSHLQGAGRNYFVNRIVMEAAITFRVVISSLCNSPSGMYILIGFSVKTSAGRQINLHVAPFYQVAVLRFSDIHKLYMLGM